MKKLIILVFLAICANAFGQVERVEPPYWWAGMKQTKLELLVYGDNISLPKRIMTTDPIIFTKL